MAESSVVDDIRVENLHYSYPPLTQGAEPTMVLRGIDFRVQRGEFVVLLGRVGAGKSTLCMALNGLVPQATGGIFKGSVCVLEQNTKEHPVPEMARTTGMVFQDPESQLVQMRVDDEIAFGLENLGVPSTEIEERVAWALDAVDLADRRRRPPLALSGGEKQRAAIAAMLAMRPRVLVLDEPTASLDPAGKAAVFNVLAALRARHDITVFMATQELERVAHYADRVLVLHDGRIIVDGPADDVLGQVTQLQELGVGAPQIAELAHLLSQGTGRRYVFTTTSAAYKQLRRRAQKAHMHSLGLGPAPIPEPPDNPFADRAQVLLEHVSYIYDDGVPALHDVDLLVRPGEFVALLGPNGAGKTTLVRHLNGLLHPSSGRVLVENQDTRQISVARLARVVGYAFQNPDHQIFAPTVREEIAFGLHNQELPENIVARRVEDVLARLDLSRDATTPPALLGFGERRKVALASVLAMQPRLLILDEPTGGLDWRSRQELMEIVAAFNAQGRTVLLITHDMRLVTEYARRAVVLLDGRVLFDGPTRDLFRQPEILAEAGLALPPVARLARRLRSEGMAPGVLTSAEFVSAWLARLAARHRRKKARRTSGKK